MRNTTVACGGAQTAPVRGRNALHYRAGAAAASGIRSSQAARICLAASTHVGERGFDFGPAAGLQAAVGLTQIFSGLMTSTAFVSSAFISAVPGIRGEWMSQTPGPISFG